MDAQGNKLSSCKIPDRYLKKTKKLLNFQNSGYFGLKKNKIKRSKVLWEELKSYGTPFGPKLFFINYPIRLINQLS